MQSDRNLLVGILALQLDFVSRDQLVAAMQAWVLKKDLPLGQILRSIGVLSRARYDLLEALVDEHVAQHNGDPTASLAAVSSIGSMRDVLQAVNDSDVQSSLQHVGSPQPAARQLDTTVGWSTSEGTRFRILRPHAQGGLGEVFVAHDEELSREVALKQIQQRHADHPQSRARFVLEAEITGGLEHPGIVPVYGLGTYGDGRPFYAMRFVRGDSLQDAIARFHARDGDPNRDAGERALTLRKLLSRFIDVCNAIEYAHSRGVLHRDLKPGNIMLGKYGETLVVDWGLAKALGRREPRYSSDETTLHPAAASGSAPTELGEAVGTPRFMSPEQAAGRIDELGAASDVYSLGATLFELLAGKPPFAECPNEEVLRRVASGQYRPLQDVKAGVPAPLIAICAKAMALRSTDRYPTPRQLADDIEHFLADEPVAAHAETFGERWRRFGRRHRAVVRWGAVALASIAVVLAAALFVVGSKNVEIRAALASQTLARQQARKAIDNYVRTVRADALLKEERFKPLLKTLLKDALAYYEEFVREHHDDATQSREVAEALFFLGWISSQSGSAGDAMQAFLSAVAINEQLTRSNPSLTDLQFLFYCFVEMSELNRWDFDTASGYLTRAVAISQRLNEEAPSAETREGLGVCYAKLGNLQRAAGRLGQALTSYQSALGIFNKLVADNAGALGVEENIASCLGSLGTIQMELGNKSEAIAFLNDSIAAHQRLLDRRPTDIKSKYSLAVGLMHLGLLRRDQSLSLHQRAVALLTEVVGAEPTVDVYQSHLAKALLNLAAEYMDQKNLVEALPACQRAVEISSRLAQMNPGTAELESTLAKCSTNLALIHREARRFDESLVYSEQALRICQKMAADYPAVPEIQDDLGAGNYNHAMLLCEMGRRPDSVPYLDEAVAVWKQAARAPRATPDRSLKMTRADCLAGKICLEEANKPGAQSHFSRAASTYEAMPSRTPVTTYDIACLKALLASICENEAGAADASPSARDQLLDSAMRWLDQAVAMGFDDLNHIENDDDLACLRERADYRALIARLKEKRQ